MLDLIGYSTWVHSAPSKWKFQGEPPSPSFDLDRNNPEMTSNDTDEKEPLINTGPTTTYSDLLKAHALVTKDKAIENDPDDSFNPSILAHSLEAYLKWPTSMSIGDIGQREEVLEQEHSKNEIQSVTNIPIIHRTLPIGNGRHYSAFCISAKSSISFGISNSSRMLMSQDH